ncbi:MAG: extracellular solute-binding protein [Ruminococcus sp.]|nr:extracellular solute-binding protein [Ruminococcus sp.]
MRKSKKVLIMAVAVMSAVVSCRKVEPPESVSTQSSVYESSVDIIETEPPEEDFDISGETITWLADYDLNPSSNGERSVALSVFEDVYGGKINFVYTTAENKFNKLSEMLASGEEVDMFPYDSDIFPIGVINEQFQPLDPYFDIMGMNEGLWDDISSAVDAFEYNGEHYVIPYNVSNPVVVTYSRKLMEQEKLEDPYELYKKGEWNWDKMMQMMQKFVENSDGSVRRYGINGSFGTALLQSTGKGIVSLENGRFQNNIKSPEIKKAGAFMQKMTENNLVYAPYLSHFAKDNSTLFFVMGSWALGESNALNPDSDLMVVPFPVSPDADKNYISCSFDARMLVRNSTKGEAVATYIKCERIASTQEEYKSTQKENALVVRKSAGKTISFVTEEQYDALQSFLDMTNSAPMFDFAYGMGEKMNSEGDYTYQTRGVMNNLTEAIPNYVVSSWSALCDEWAGVIDDVVNEVNNRIG